MSVPGAAPGVAVVTGAGSGLGLASARALRGAGMRLHLIDRDEAALARAAEALGGADTHRLDVTDADAVARVFGAIGPVGVLVNSAGIAGPNRPLEDCTADDLREIFEVNLIGSFLCAQGVARGLRQAGCGGCIVNIASTAALRGTRRLGAYAISKAALISMTRSLAISLAPDGIRVNAVLPGAIAGEMFDRSLSPDDPEADRAGMVALHPLGRLGEADDVAAAVAYLAGPQAGFVTGALLPVDGGRLA